MHLGLIIYGGLEPLTGGYIYDRILVDYLRAAAGSILFLLPPATTAVIYWTIFRRNSGQI